MPSITAYTPFETLKLCQSIARHGADASTFEEIAASLNANELIRESENYDEERLSPSALQSLYDDLLARERDGSPKVNGDTASEPTNPRKRKLSASPGPSNGEQALSNEDLINSLVEKLYARFREEVIKEIKRDEEEYEQLHSDIKSLEAQVENASTKAENPEAAAATPTQHRRQPSRTDVSALLSPHDETPAYSKQGQEERLLDQTGSRPSSNDEGRPPSLPNIPPPVVPSQQSPATASSRPSAEPGQQPLQPPNLNQSPAAFHRTLPPPSPQRQSFGPPPPHHGYAQGPQGHPVPILPPLSGMPSHMPPPIEYNNQKRSSSTSTPARGSPVPPPQQQYPGYPPYPQQPPPWPHQYPPPQHPYPQHVQYPNQPYYVQSPGGRPPYQTPHPSPYPPYHQPSPGHYPGPLPQGWHHSPQPPYSQPTSAGTTPIQQTSRRQMVRSSGSSTPWKKTPLRPGQARPSSPTRPERDVSPLTDTEPETKQERHPSERNSSRVRPTLAEEASSRRSTRRGRPPSATPSGIPESRSQSIASQKSQTPSERPGTRRAQQIKDETPSTPVPAFSDADQSRSGPRRGRLRNATLTSDNRPDVSRTSTVRKRKRSPPLPGSSATPPLPSPTAPSTVKPTPHNHPIYVHEPGLVLISKNFAKTSQLVLNEITSHKLASIFAKPLSERDAPGYKDLVLRPQDLKSIRTAVNKGSRAAVAAIEALESERSEAEGQETPIKANAVGGEDGRRNDKGEGPVGNGMFLVSKTEELVPPKGIVNSSQLEMELTRMFANAVMFNPLPTGERAFGRNLRIRKNGGDLHARLVGDDDGEDGQESASGSEDGSETSGSSSSSEGGGIIADSREMFEDVVGAVGRWREVEVERITGASGSGEVGARQASVSDAMHEDEGVVGTPTTGGGGEGEGIGTTRKRRRINER